MSMRPMPPELDDDVRTAFSAERLGISNEGEAFWEWPGMMWRWLMRNLARLSGRTSPTDGASSEPSPPAP